MTTLVECFRQGRARLKQTLAEDAEYDALRLFESVFGMNRQALLLHGEEPAQELLCRRFQSKIEQRAAGRPVQYILGEWEFCGLPFFVGEGVLIPREETALLVDAAVDFCRVTRQPRILDLCSGSGAIAVACAKAIPDASVTACELSPQALEYLQRNVERSRTAVQIRRCDVLAQPRSGDFLPQDVILSNPPYIETAELPGLQREVRHEPQMALDGGADGLKFYRAILSGWLRFLRPGGLLAVECGIGQAHTIEKMFSEYDLRTSVRKDFAGIDRAVCGKKPESDCILPQNQVK